MAVFPISQALRASPHYAQSEVLHLLACKGSSTQLDTLLRVMDSTVVKYAAKVLQEAQLACHRHVLICHWVLTSRSKKHTSLLRFHVSSLMGEMRCMQRILGKTVSRSGSDNGEAFETGDKSSPSKPSLPFLDAATFPDYLETIAVLIVGSVAVEFLPAILHDHAASGTQHQTMFITLVCNNGTISITFRGQELIGLDVGNE